MAKTGGGGVKIGEGRVSAWAVWTMLCCQGGLIVNAGFAGIAEVDKPRDSMPAMRPRVQNYEIPGGLKAYPFAETNPKPEFRPEENNRGFMLFRRDVTDVVYPNTRPLPHERFETLGGFAAPGEVRAITFSVYPGRELKNFKVRGSALKSGSAQIPASALDIRLATYWDVRYPWYRSNTYRRAPELLEKVTVYSSPAEKCQRYWIVVRVPEDAKAGLYEGSVTVWDDGYGKALSIPLKFRVLGFPLMRDPNKFLSAYNRDLYLEREGNLIRRYYPHLARDEAWFDKAVSNEYAYMVETGINAFPVLSTMRQPDPETGAPRIHGGTEPFEKMKKAGMGHFATITFDGMVAYLYNKHTGKTHARHWVLPENPPDAFYKDVTEAVTKLEQWRQDNNLPEFVYAALDETSPVSQEFGSRTYKAVRAAGVRTLNTKNPLASDAAPYMPYVSIWSSMPFAVPYETAAAGGFPEYWSYPNHVSAGNMDPKARSKGGRMTYGFGFWRSGYPVLQPWAWRWPIQDQGATQYELFNYMNGGSSQSGNYINEDGDVVPAINWACFREGYNDSRYLYTLQTEIVRREKSSDPACRAAVQEARAFLQEVWDGIPVRQEYLDNFPWTEDTFDALRWRMAVYIERLRAFPAESDALAPSVVVSDTSRAFQGLDLGGVIEKARQDGLLKLHDLGANHFKGWVAMAKEASSRTVTDVKRSGNNALLFSITMDHKTSGEANPAHLLGWPRLRMTFPGGSDFTQWDYLYAWIRVESDRDDIAKEETPLMLSVRTGRRDYQHQVFGAVQENIWMPIVIPVTEFSGASFDSEEWKNVQYVQFWIEERSFPHQSTLRIYFDEIALVSFKNPTIQAVIPSAMLLPAYSVGTDYQVLGIPPSQADQYTIHGELQDAGGRTISSASRPFNPASQLGLDARKLSPGPHVMTLWLTDRTGRRQGVWSGKFEAISGPLEKLDTK